MKLSSLLKFFLPILIIALSVVGFQYLKSSKTERKKPEAKEKIWRVDAQKITLESVAADLTLYATIESSSLLTAAAPAAGMVLNIFVKSGQSVTKGDVLLELDQSDFLNTLNQAKADVLDLKAQLTQLSIKHQANQQSLALEQTLLALSQGELDRVTRLQKKGLGSDSALTDVKSAFAKQQLSVLNKNTEVAQFEVKKQQLNAKLMRLNAQRSQAQLALDRSVIYAEFEGIVVDVNVAKGDRVKSAQPLLSLYPKQKLEAKTRVPSRYQQEIQRMLSSGQAVTASAKISGKSIALKLDRIAGQASARGIEVYFNITAGQQWLRVGNFLKLRVQRAKQHNVVKLPLHALYGTNRIYRIVDERLEALDVETVGHVLTLDGQQNVLIRHPKLKPDDRIMLTHLPNAMTGLKVKISAK